LSRGGDGHDFWPQAVRQAPLPHGTLVQEGDQRS
jgi:hypothetical protein